MGQEFNLEVPYPLLVQSDEEAEAVRQLWYEKARLYPDEPFGFDTETHGKKIEWETVNDRGEKKKKDLGLDWMFDTVLFWSIAARMDRELQPQWEAYLQKFHPEALVDGYGDAIPAEPYGRWCIGREYLPDLGPFLEDPRILLVTWNGKYDAHVSFNSRLYVWNTELGEDGRMRRRYLDLMVAGYLHDENLQGKMTLKDRAKAWCGLQMTPYKDLFEYDAQGNKAVEYKTSLLELPIDKVSDYASYDAYATLRLYDVLKERLSEEEIDGPEYTMWDYFLDTESLVTEVLWRMERRGMLIDQGALGEVLPLLTKSIAEIHAELNQEFGTFLNVNSPKQLAGFFFGEESTRKYKMVKATKKGGSVPSTDAEVMERLAVEQRDPVARDIIKFRKVGKIKSTYVEPMTKLTKHYGDDRIHPSFNQYGARTGRFSTQTPNSQNMPRPDGDVYGIRKMFVPPPGRLLIVSDYEQLEMRIMAHFSQDNKMVSAIREGMDLHCYTVSVMNNVPYDEVFAAKKSKEPTEEQKELLRMRQHAKVIGFGLLYGAGASRTAAELDITKAEAEEKINAYFRAFPGVAAYIDYTHERCREIGFVTTLLGRRRRLPQINNKIFMLRSAAEREAVNSVIQGTAADITKAAMINIEFDDWLQDHGIRLLNQIHDELVMEVPAENAELVLPRITAHMERPFDPNEDPLIVPTPVDAKIVQRWADAK
jgi:DNA polymerase-1